MTTDQPFDWRAYVRVHPAADFPLLPPDELQALAADIKEHGLRSPIILCQEGWRDKDGAIWLLDGRNRLDALALLGWLEPPRERSKREPAKKYQLFVRDNPLAISDECPYSDVRGFQTYSNCDPYALALSLNIHRRHLTAEQKRELIAKLLKAKPEASNVTIAKQVKADDKTVAKVRRDLESTSEIPRLERTVGLDNKTRKAPQKKAKPVTTVTHRKPGDYWSGQDCGGNWYVSVVTDEMGPATWKSKDAAGPFETEAEAQAWIVEEDRKTCIALNQKALDAEREYAGIDKARREKREEKIGQENHRNILLMNSAASIQCAEYCGPIDDEIVAACRRTAQAWNELANKLANKLAATSATGSDEAMKVERTGDGLDIPGFLDRTGSAASGTAS